MGYLAPIFWAFMYVLIISLCEFSAYHFFSEFSDRNLVTVLLISFVLGCLISYRNVGYLIFWYSFIGLIVVAIAAFSLKLDFYYQGYPDNIIEFLPNVVFKPMILLGPLFVSFIVVKIILGFTKGHLEK